MWTQFMDMHSGGGQKLDWAYIYIEAPEKEAERVFQARFGRNPHRVTCTCCGPDYSISESETLAQATAYERGCRFIADERGWKNPKPTDYREGRYIEHDEEVPAGYAVNYLASYRWNNRKTLDEYLGDSGVKVIRAGEIEPHERLAELRPEGFVWAS